MTEQFHLGPITVADVTNPKPHEVHIPTVIDRINAIRRFVGAPDALTVLQHCRLTKALAIQDNAPWRVVQWAWRHDWHEAATGDIPAPVKRAISSAWLEQIERAWDRAIALAETIQPPDMWVREQVQHYDLLACRMEMEAIGMTPCAHMPSVESHYDLQQAWAYAIGREMAA